MKIGALIVTTGLSRISGVAALLSEVGAITAGQRMISAFQCAGVSLVGLVVGPEDKKSERQRSGLTLKGNLLMDAYDQFAEHLNREAQALYGKFFNSLVEVT